MELREVVRNRRSIRKFLPEPVPEEVIKEIIGQAVWAPSWGNTQPWEIVAVVGQKLEEFKRRSKQAMLEGREQRTDIPVPEKWPEPLKARYKEVGKSVLSSLSIAREDSEGRLDYYTRMLSFFDGPALLMLLAARELNLEYTMLDCGILVQNICLLAHDRGLGTCILAASISYPEIARELLSIPESRRLVIGLALGWPDPAAPENNFERKRGSVEEFMRWVR